ALELLLVESGGGKPAAPLRPGPGGAAHYAIHLARGEKNPRKGGPGGPPPAPPPVNKINPAPPPPAPPGLNARGSRPGRAGGPCVFTNRRDGTGADRVIAWLRRDLLLAA